MVLGLAEQRGLDRKTCLAGQVFSRPAFSRLAEQGADAGLEVAGRQLPGSGSVVGLGLLAWRRRSRSYRQHGQARRPSGRGASSSSPSPNHPSQRLTGTEAGRGVRQRVIAATKGLHLDLLLRRTTLVGVAFATRAGGVAFATARKLRRTVAAFTSSSATIGAATGPALAARHVVAAVEATSLGRTDHGLFWRREPRQVDGAQVG